MGHKITFFLLAILSISLNAQTIKVNPKPGDVSRDEVSMTSYQPDSSANAVVLYKTCEVFTDVRDDFVREERHYYRVKILKEGGLDYGNMKIRYYFNTRSGEEDFVENIKVSTYNLENGKVVESKMSKKAVFDEKVTDNHHVTKLSAPNVKIGSVVEFSYIITSHRFWEIPNYYLQEDIPVNSAYYDVSYPEYFIYNKRSQGYDAVHSESSKESSTISTHYGAVDMVRYTDTYQAVDLPAMKKESYSYSLSQYKDAVIYSLKLVSLPGETIQNYGSTWEDVDKQLLDVRIVSRLNSSNPLKKETQDIMAGQGDDEAKIVSLWKMVKQSVKWDGDIDLYSDKSPADVIKSGTGSNVEINTLLGSVLSDAGYHVEPVMIKLRTSGFLLDFAPSADEYDTFILRVSTSSGAVYYIEGADSRTYLNVLPETYLVERARILRKEGSEWVDLTRLCLNTSNYYADASLTPDGTIKGHLEFTFKNMESEDFKSAYHYAESEDKFLSDFESDNSIKVSDAVFTNVKEITPGCSLTANYQAGANVSGDFIYITPMIVKLFSSSSFKNTTRKFPIEFPYPYITKYTFILTIPEGYQIEQLPKTSVYSFQNLGSQFTIVSNELPNSKVIFRVSYKIDKILSSVSDYQAIRQYWNVLSDSANEMIVLKKKAQ